MRVKSLVLAAAFLVLVSSPTAAKIIHVPSDSSTIQSGINGTVDGDTVLVEKGIYYENILITKTIVLASNFIFDGNWATIESTIIDNDYQSDHAVTICREYGGERPTPLLTGLTVQKGYSNHGGGIWCVGNPIIKHNILTKNIANHSYDAGAAIYHQEGSAKITGNLIYDNDGVGAIECGYRSSAEIIGNTISFNSDGGIFCKAVAIPAIIIKNNIITSNNTFGIENFYAIANLLVDYNDVWGHGINYKRYIGPGEHDISDDPLFCDTSNNNFHLYNTSSSLGAGEGGVDLGAFGEGCFRTLGIDIIPGDAEDGLIGQDTQLVFYAKNTGTQTESYSLLASDSSGWELNLNDDLTLAPQQTDSVYVIVSVPYGQDIIGMVDDVKLTGVSQSDPDIYDEETIPLAAVSYYGFRLNPGDDVVTRETGVSVQAQIIISNIGLMSDIYDISVWDQLGWETDPTQTSVQIGPSEDSIMSFTVTLPPFPQLASDSLTLKASSQGNSDFVDSTGLWVRIHITGDVNGDAKIDLVDVIYLINYCFKDGPPPHYPEAGDVDCSGLTGLDDVIYLVNYLFKSSPPPCEPE